MSEKREKPLVCPNCFGTDHREVLATSISRDDNEDSSPAPAQRNTGDGRRKEYVKLFCIHCGNELTRSGGGRA